MISLIWFDAGMVQFIRHVVLFPTYLATSDWLFLSLGPVLSRTRRVTATKHGQWSSQARVMPLQVPLGRRAYSRLEMRIPYRRIGRMEGIQLDLLLALRV
jgi:hypothetical protein